MRTLEPFGPTLLGQVFGTRKVVREVRGELLQRRRAIFAPAAREEIWHAALIAGRGIRVMRERYKWLMPERKG